MLYFDHNATSPLCPAARDAWLDAQERFPGNPSSLHRLGSRAGVALEEARERMAALLGCPAAELVFCSGATEANNAVLAHLAGCGTGEAWVSAVEHPSVLEAVRAWFPGRHRLVPVGRDGLVDVDWIAAGLRRGRPAFVGVMAVNNETGVVQPWGVVGALCREAGVPFFCDAVQFFGKDASVAPTLPDYWVGCAHKFGGPKGVGFFRVGRGFRGLLRGGPQEEGRRAGTENLAGIMAMEAALRDRVQRIRTPGFLAERLRWRGAFEALLASRLPGLSVLGSCGFPVHGGDGREGTGGGEDWVGPGGCGLRGHSGITGEDVAGPEVGGAAAASGPVQRPSPLEAGGRGGLEGRGREGGGGRRAGGEGAEEGAGGPGCSAVAVAPGRWPPGSNQSGAGPSNPGVLSGEPAGAGSAAAASASLPQAGRIWNTTSLMLPEVDCRQRWVVKLDRLGAAVSTGSACASGKEQVSHVLAAMGLAEGQAARVVRVSSGWETTAEDWRQLGALFLDAATQLGF